MEDDKGLYTLCKQALEQTMSEDLYQKYGGFSIESVLKHLLELTSPFEYSRDFLFEKVAKLYIAICANTLGQRAGMKRSGVYFSEDILNKSIAKQLFVNAKNSADSYGDVAREREDRYLVVKDTIDGQLRLGLENDDDGQGGMSILEEKSIEWFTNLIKEADAL